VLLKSLQHFIMQIKAGTQKSFVEGMVWFKLATVFGLEFAKISHHKTLKNH
jgi:hypothetical protein